MKLRACPVVAACGAVLLAAVSAQAGSIVQPLRGGTIQILYASPAGQTFTAEDARIDSIGFWVVDFNPHIAPLDFAVDIRLYEGDGFGGTLLGSGTFGGLSRGYSGWADVLFPLVMLQPGHVYTAQIADETPRWGVSNYSDVYPGGNTYYFGNPYPNVDLTFRVLVPEVPVPEPGSLGLLLLGGALLLGRHRTR